MAVVLAVRRRRRSVVREMCIFFVGVVCGMDWLDGLGVGDGGVDEGCSCDWEEGIYDRGGL